MAAQPLAPTRSGQVRGSVTEPGDRRRQTVRSFRGIPFAGATSGVGRFRPPTPEQPWTGERDATSFGPVAPQAPSALETLFGSQPISWSEDCLTLNVWTPALDGAKRTVMVWIHGGAFVTGSGATPWYDGTQFAANHDVVVVTLNYRLGALGFGNISALAPDVAAERGLVTNCGLLDQVAALRWVRDCIAAFGGDAENVTIFGESAGAMSVATLLGVPAAKGLFRRAIMQSGAASHVFDPEGSTSVAAALLTELGLSADEAGVEALLDVDAAAIVKATAVVAARPLKGALPFQPTVEQATLPEHPHDAVLAGAGAGIDVLFGTNRDEMRLYTAMDTSVASIDRETMARRIRHAHGDRSPEVVDTYIAGRPGLALSEVWPDIATDMTFRGPANRLASYLHPWSNRMWAYEFHYASPAFGGTLRSCHALEIPFVFDNLHQPGASVFTGDGGDRQGIADVLHGAWASFARTGDPNGGLPDGAPVWPVFSPGERGTYAVDTEVRVEHAPRDAELQHWS